MISKKVRKKGFYACRITGEFKGLIIQSKHESDFELAIKKLTKKSIFDKIKDYVNRYTKRNNV